QHQAGATCLSSGWPLFRRLKDKLHAPPKAVAKPAEGFRHSQRDRGVNIMPAGMFYAVVHGFVRNVVDFLNWKGVHVRSDGYCRSGTGPFKKGHHTGFGDTCLNLKSQPAEKTSHFFGSTKLAVSELR